VGRVRLRRSGDSKNDGWNTHGGGGERVADAVSKELVNELKSEVSSSGPSHAKQCAILPDADVRRLSRSFTPSTTFR